jgi:hypothetical protein
MPNPDDEAAAEGGALEHAQGVLTGLVEGDLRFDEHGMRLKFVHDPASGRLLASVPVAVFSAAEHVLFLPEETEDALQLLISPEEVGESAVTDRWMAYHGDPEHVRWASFWIDGARHGPWVFDGEALAMANALAKEESGLCRVANADRAKLAAACERMAGIAVPDAVCVGVDPRGLHVRARFGVVRVRFSEDGEAVSDAAAALGRLLG